MAVDAGVLDSIGVLIESVKATKDYRDYDMCRNKVLGNQELKDKILRAKEVRKQIERLPESELNGDYADRLEDEYEELTEDTDVHVYMQAELRICGILQQILSEVVKSVDVDL